MTKIPRQCKLDDCTEKYYCRDYCVTHYSRWKRHGDPYFVIPAKEVVKAPKQGRTNANTIAVGETFGYWTVTGPFTRQGKENQAFFPCQCVCGTLRDVKLRTLIEAKKGKVKGSCGCAHTEAMAEKRKYIPERTRFGKMIWTKYRISLEDFDKMVIEQSGRCAICSEELTDPYIDHCHETDKVRGLLCHNCNTLLGHSKDDMVILRNAISYLQQIVND